MAPRLDAPVFRLRQNQPAQPPATDSAETPASPAAAPADAQTGEAVLPDPMAPRPDAPVFRLRQTQTDSAQPNPPEGGQPAATPDTTGGARYYSIHRQAGRTPDAPRLPEPVYLDALPVELNGLPETQDLAEPPPPPALMRDSQGRVRPVPEPDNDPSLD